MAVGEDFALTPKSTCNDMIFHILHRINREDRAVFASSGTIELDQSAENVGAATEAAMQDYPVGER